MKVMVTGAAGFIGSHVSLNLMQRGDEVVGVDNMNDYYDVALKEARLDWLHPHAEFSFHKLDVADRDGLSALFEEQRPQRVVHLAAQAGVRYSMTNPHTYVNSNLLGFINILEGCRNTNVQHLVYASSSSVYGGNTRLPFSVDDNVDHPLSLYAATKKANELMAHTYSHLYRLPTTGLRFFTVYGPWGRPDMSLFLFTKNILAGKPIDVFNYGEHERDFTFVDDIVDGVVKCMDTIATPDSAWSSDAHKPGTSNAPYRLHNIGNHEPVHLMKFISILEECLGMTAEKKMLPMRREDVPATFADIDSLVESIDFHPATSVETGIARFVKWYREFYGNRPA